MFLMVPWDMFNSRANCTMVSAFSISFSLQ
jgi:hypothetical protein